MTAHGFRRTPFASRLLRHAMRDRARRETGSPASPTSPMFDDWREGIHGWVRQRTVDLVAEGGLRLHDHIAAVNSSTAFGLVHHPDNHHVVEPWEHYRSLVADASPLFRIPANELIDAAADQNVPWPDWACYMRERYMLARNGTSE